MNPFFMLDLPEFVRTVGYLGIFVTVFLESGIPVGFFLPGDTLLFTAGLLSSLGAFSLPLLVALVVIAAVAGDSAGYWLGTTFGRKLFQNEKALFLSKKNLDRTEAFYEKHGAKAIILARFVPIVRTFTPILAGVGSMTYATFIRYNLIGALLWGAGVTILGYALGSVIPDVDRYLLPIIVIIGIASTLPVLKELFFRKRSKETTA